MNAAVATGMASTDDTVYFAWQDSRAGSNETESEDVYFARLQRGGSVVTRDDAGVPGWMEIGAGVALGLGVGMILVWGLARRSRQRVLAG